MNLRFIRFRRPSLWSLVPEVLRVPCTNLSVAIYYDREMPARWQHQAYPDGSGGELRCGRWLFLYGVDEAGGVVLSERDRSDVLPA
jgi:hypothetical protein